MIGGVYHVRWPNRTYIARTSGTARDCGRCPRVIRTVTSEPQTELRAEPDQAWLPDGRTPTSQDAQVAPSGRHRRAPRGAAPPRDDVAVRPGPSRSCAHGRAA